MSSAVANAAPLKAEIRLAQAVSQFKADLSPEQKATFDVYQNASLRKGVNMHDVMQLTAEINRPTFGDTGGRCFGPRLTNILHSVQQFAALGDVVVGASQNIVACGVWALVRMALLVGSLLTSFCHSTADIAQSIFSFSSCLEKVSNLLMVVGRSAPRYEKMALLYPRSKSLQSHLSEYFIVVVRLCHHLLKLTKKSALERLVPFPSNFDTNYQEELEQWASSIREEVSLLGTAEQRAGFRALMRSSEFKAHRRRVEARVRVLEACSTFHHQTTWKEIRKVGDAALFHRTPEYQHWKTRAESSTLVYTGKLGSGKSVLLANIVDDLHLSSAERSVAYFFCRHDISESMEPRTVLGSLARQLLDPFPDLTMVEDVVDRTPLPLDSETIFDLLQRALPPKFKAYFVLDGLDECDDSQRETLIEELWRLQDRFTLLVCVSFRLEADNALRLHPEAFAEQRSIAIPDDNPDMRVFISAELERRIESGRLMIGEPTLILEIEDSLLQGAQGMFLWTALQIESLCAAKTDEAIRQALADLPKNLPETFSRIQRRSAELGENYQTRILELVTVARRPLTTEELREALSVVPGDAVWNPRRLLNNVYSALACCGSLILVDEEESTVRLIHHSVKQFFLGEFQDSTGAIFTLESANRTMGDIIITYLNYGVFDSRLSTAVAPELPVAAVPSRVIRSINASSFVRNTALQLLQSRRQPNGNMSKVLTDARKHFQSPSVDQIQFYSYAKRYWLPHVWHVSDHEPEVSSLLLKVPKREIANVNMKDDESRMLLVRAVEKGREAIITLLLEKGADVNAKDNCGQTLLRQAGVNRHDTIVRLLLENGADIDEKDDEHGHTLLSWAAENGHDPIVQLLLEKGADIEMKDRVNGQTPL